MNVDWAWTLCVNKMPRMQREETRDLKRKEETHKEKHSGLRTMILKSKVPHGTNAASFHVTRTFNIIKAC